MTSPEIQPVFYTATPTRWKRLKAGFRLGLALVLMVGLIAVLAFTLEAMPGLPRLTNPATAYHPLLNPSLGVLQTHTNREYQKGRRKLQAMGHPEGGASVSPFRAGSQIRAGFYVNWDAQSMFSLQENIDRMNMVFPEWMFVPDTGDQVVINLDEKALTLLRQHNVATLPMVSNFFSGKWNGGNVARIIRSPQSRATFIASILEALRANQFQGVNIDFEDLGALKTDEHLVAFQHELYQSLHSQGFLVTQDIAPFNEDYPLEKLATWNDYLVVMAYDQHDSSSVPGPVAAQDWLRAALKNVSQHVQGSKLIAGVAAYGYDWPKGGMGNDVSYQEAIVTAAESQCSVQWHETGNLHYTYDDEEDRSHDVWFTDAATAYNTMREAADAGMAGVAIWRLGSEDPRLWSFFARDLSHDGLKHTPFDLSPLGQITPTSSVDFIGEGEVLDLVSSPATGQARLDWDPVTQAITGETYDTLPSGYVVRKFGKAPERFAVLTFDDGPDRKWTPKILDILQREGVPATFFLVGKNAEENPGLVRRLYNEGFEIGNHTFSHPNLALVSPDRARLELEVTRRLIECLTQHSTVIFRPPYNADSEPQTMEEIEPLAMGKSHHFYAVGESIDPLDWEKGVNADTILERVKSQLGNGGVILLHDAGGNRQATVDALPRVIAFLRSQGYTFGSVAQLLGKTREDLMPSLPPGRDRWIARLDLGLSQSFYWTGLALVIIFFLGIVLSIGRILAMALLSALHLRRDKLRVLSKERPPVSVIVPGYNEEVTATKTIENLLRSTYPDLEIVFVDDGSRDRTLEVVQAAFGDHPKVKVLTKPNGGKASALNHGIAQASHEILVCIDADTVLEPDAIERLVERFTSPQVAAVAGNVKVGNERSMLTRWQSIEYITSQNFDRRAFAYLGCITVIPGAIGAFRREAIQAVGGFTTDTLAEDCDLTLRILRTGGIVDYSAQAIAWTEAPETLNMFLRQRFRWSFGILQSFWKHRIVVFGLEQPALGWVALPNMFLFQLVQPLLSPLVDIVMVLAILEGHALQILTYYGLFLLVDLVGATLAFSYERESLKRLWLLIPQRIIYRYLLYWALARSVITALRGQMQGWGVLKRTGNVGTR